MDERKAKELAAGALGEKMAKFPLLFAKAAFFGLRPSKDRPADVNSGTVMLADLGTGPLAVTCQHVIACYRTRIAREEDIIFKIGNADLDPLEQLVAEDQRRDIATIRLTGEQVTEITSEGEIGSCVFVPKEWPSPSPRRGEYVAFGGFPGRLRTVRSFDELDFGSWSSGASEISSISESQFVSAFEREYWVSNFGSAEHNGLDMLGGMSGGPALINRGLYWDLVGMVSQYHEEYDAMFFSLLNAVHPDGTIEPLPV